MERGVFRVCTDRDPNLNRLVVRTQLEDASETRPLRQQDRESLQQWLAAAPERGRTEVRRLQDGEVVGGGIAIAWRLVDRNTHAVTC